MARLTKNQFKRGEIWVTSLLGQGVGTELGKKRPALIISANSLNGISPLVIVLPVSSQIPPVIGPDRILLPKKTLKLDRDSIILVNHIRAIDKSRLVKKIGKLPQDKMEEVEEALKLVLGLIDIGD